MNSLNIFLDGSVNSSLWDLQYGTLLNEHTAALPDKDSKSAKHEEIIQVCLTDNSLSLIYEEIFSCSFSRSLTGNAPPFSVVQLRLWYSG